VLTTPNILTSVLLFPFSGTSEYRKSLSFSWHMNLKNNTPRMHHITSLWDEKFLNFLGRGTISPQTLPLAAYGASILASSALDLRPPNVPVALTPMITVRLVCVRRMAAECCREFSSRSPERPTTCAHPRQTLYTARHPDTDRQIRLCWPLCASSILVSRSTQPSIPPGSLNRVPASSGVRAGMSPLPGGR